MLQSPIPPLAGEAQHRALARYARDDELTREKSAFFEALSFPWRPRAHTERLPRFTSAAYGVGPLIDPFAVQTRSETLVE